ncbi:mitochondrial distribution and morphology [Malassezia psittaci]|uniref:Mitochondrial distribution and morphology n=1 Tax=Malassezia psittaci TaxID=1821823 RepID=A0AAF0JFD3_9BASI|nr:mitochondrial distribution and morphology [Malassezia psittaci]
MAAHKSVFDQYLCNDIYNALDTGNYTLAVSKADQVLRQKNIPLAGALRSFALLQLDREEEAHSQIGRILTLNLDTTVLATLAMVMPRLGMSKQLAELYILASDAHPKDQKLAKEALTALVKAGMYQRAQQLLLKEFKSKKDSESYWRYLQLAVLHSQTLKLPGSKLALTVAQRLVKDYPVQADQFTEETLFLYLRFHILLGDEHLKFALQLLDQPKPMELIKNSVGLQFLQREAWEACKQHERILNDCRVHIVNGDRNWAVIEYFVQLLVQEALQKDSRELNTDGIATLVEAAEKDQWNDRGSFLGVLELCRHAREAKLSEAFLKSYNLDLLELVVKYCSRFDSRATCFEDIRPYLIALSESQRKNLHAKVPQKQDLTSEEGITRCVNWQKIVCLLDLNAGTSNPCGQMLSCFIESLRHARLPNTEMQYADDLLLLAMYSGTDASDEEGQFFAALVAYFGVSESSRAYFARILLIRLLLQLGAVNFASKQFKALGLKAVQWDTASFFGLDRNTAFGGSIFQANLGYYNDNLRAFYAQSQSELPDVISRAFNNNKFSQISGLCEFERCVNYSVTRAIVDLDIIRAKIVTQQLSGASMRQATSTVKRIVTAAEQDAFHDQRDYSLIPSFNDRGGQVIQSLLHNRPVRGAYYIKAMSNIIGLYLDLDIVEQYEGSEELTLAESNLVHLAAKLRRSKDDATKTNTALYGFLQNTSHPFDTLHTAWIGIEGVHIASKIIKSDTEQNKSLPSSVIDCVMKIEQKLLSKIGDKSAPIDLDRLRKKISQDQVFGKTSDLIPTVCKERAENLKEVSKVYRDIYRTHK